MFKPSKVYFQNQLIEKIQAFPADVKIRMLELGCGRAEVTAEILRACPTAEYIGIEPDPNAFAVAKRNLMPFPNATVLHGLGYGQVTHADLQTPFDIVYSLSVLEHVKDLKTFLAYATKVAKSGAEIIHLYDLGHSLHPGSLKEVLQTRLCNTAFLRFVPESKVARYLATEDIQRQLEQTGCQVERITYHNMMSHMALLKAVPSPDPSLVDHIVKFEEEASALVTNVKQKEKLFPSVCFWTKKK